MGISTENLQSCYTEAVNKLIPFTREARTGTNFKIDRMNHLFENANWKQLGKKSGHIKFKNQVTDVIVEFQNHTGRGDNVIKPTIQLQVLNQVQTHLNILCNFIFRYRVSNWKDKPDYNRALLNYQEWVKTKEAPLV